MTLRALRDAIRYGLAAIAFVACILNVRLALYLIGLVVVSEIVHWVVHGDKMSPAVPEAIAVPRRNGYTVSDGFTALDRAPVEPGQIVSTDSEHVRSPTPRTR